MKILLVNPIYNPGTIPPSIPLSKIAAGLIKAGMIVETIDFVCPECEGKSLAFFRKAENDFLNKIKMLAYEVDCVYITSGTGNELKPYPIFPRIKTIAQNIKGVKKVPIFVGGALINLYTRVYKLSNTWIRGEYIDYLVSGNEYYSVMKSLVGDGFPKSISPLWDVWDKRKYPKYKSVQYHVGCPYSCEFCFEGKIHDSTSNSEQIKDLIAAINEGDNIIFEDSVFMSYKDFDLIMDGFQSKRIKFAAYARINEIVEMPRKIERLQKAGCQSLIIGIETLDSNVLKEYNKNIVSTQTREALDILKSNNIGVQGCFMLGFPEDSKAGMERTINFAVEEKLQGYRWHIYQPNFCKWDKSFYSGAASMSVWDHCAVQLNVPDNCLHEIMVEQPEIGKLDEHFMFRGKKFLSPEVFKDIGYKDRFSYKDVKELIDDKFPEDWILNEELLYMHLFE